ncbi:Segregation and condensation protein B [Geobacillus sp. BCO2]|nr:Segregation and condensation protein B [Geobacillus sp. BCO2]
MSQAALETLAIIAYRQPITRAEIEEIRGVKSDKPLQTLMARALIQEVGRAEGTGRPILYGTTPEFLDYFGLKTLEELPPLPEWADDGESEREADLFFEKLAENLSDGQPEYGKLKEKWLIGKESAHERFAACTVKSCKNRNRTRLKTISTVRKSRTVTGAKSGRCLCCICAILRRCCLIGCRMKAIHCLRLTGAIFICATSLLLSVYGKIRPTGSAGASIFMTKVSCVAILSIWMLRSCRRLSANGRKPASAACRSGHHSETKAGAIVFLAGLTKGCA